MAKFRGKNTKWDEGEEVVKRSVILNRELSDLADRICEELDLNFAFLMRQLLRFHGEEFLKHRGQEPEGGAGGAGAEKGPIQNKQLAKVVQQTAQRLSMSQETLIEKAVEQGIESLIQEAVAREQHLKSLNQRLSGEGA